MEIEAAERTSRRIQRHREQSEPPAGETFASFDFDAAPELRKQQLLALGAGADWIANGDNLLLFGESGTAKSHAMAAIRHALIDDARNGSSASSARSPDPTPCSPISRTAPAAARSSTRGRSRSTTRASRSNGRTTASKAATGSKP